jgi:hypothetical protein
VKSYDSIRTFQDLDKWVLIRRVIPWLYKKHKTYSGRGSTRRGVRAKYLNPRPKWTWRITAMRTLGKKMPKGGNTKKKHGKQKAYTLQRLYDPISHKFNSYSHKTSIPYSAKVTKDERDSGRHKHNKQNPYTFEGQLWWIKWKIKKIGTVWNKTEESYSTIRQHAEIVGGYTCFFCQLPLEINGESTELHRIKPGKLRGRYTYKNVRAAHKTCHQEHHKKTTYDSLDDNSKFDNQDWIMELEPHMITEWKPYTPAKGNTRKKPKGAYRKGAVVKGTKFKVRKFSKYK